MNLPWQVASQEWRDLYASMPKTRDGHVVSVEHAPPDQRPRIEREWVAWAMAHGRKHWDAWLVAYMDKAADKAPKPAQVPAQEPAQTAISTAPVPVQRGMPWTAAEASAAVYDQDF